MRCTKVMIITATALLSGCAVQPRPSQTTLPRQDRYQDVAAASLVFTPPICRDQPSLLLPRDEREPSIFLGYEESVTYSYLQMDDNQGDRCWGGNYTQRRAYSEKVGVSYR